MYREDGVRAQFYKVFFAEDLAKQDQTRIRERFPPVYNETFNLLENKVSKTGFFFDVSKKLGIQKN